MAQRGGDPSLGRAAVTWRIPARFLQVTCFRPCLSAGSTHLPSQAGQVTADHCVQSHPAGFAFVQSESQHPRSGRRLPVTPRLIPYCSLHARLQLGTLGLHAFFIYCWSYSQPRTFPTCCFFSAWSLLLQVSTWLTPSSTVDLCANSFSKRLC